MAENPEPNTKGRRPEAGGAQPRTWTEQFEVAGSELVKFIGNLIREGNVRRVIVRQEGRVLFDLPLTAVAVAGVVTAIWAPFLAALGGVAGLVLLATGKVTVVVERVDTGAGEGTELETRTRVEVRDED